jgi:hypothetical protein
MNETYSLGLSLLDFVPNVAFVVGAYYLVRWARLTALRFTVVSMVVGASLVLLGGTSKAIWKLLYTFGVGDFWLLSELQFMVLAPGFLIMLAGLIPVVKVDRGKSLARLAAIAPWKIPLLVTMTLGSLGFHGILSYIALRRKAYLGSAMFLLAIICMLSMAGIAGGEQSIARQWLEEGVNSLGQITFAVGSYLLYIRTRTVGA